MGKAVTTAMCCCQSNHAYVGLVQIIFTAAANGDYASQHKVQSYADFGGNYHKEKEMQTSKLHIAWWIQWNGMFLQYFDIMSELS